MKARKKPVVIEVFFAVERPDRDSIPVWLERAIDKLNEEVGAVWAEHGRIYVRSKEGIVSGMLDHTYIMQGVKDEIYLCDKAIFDATYDVVPEETPLG